MKIGNVHGHINTYWRIHGPAKTGSVMMDGLYSISCAVHLLLSVHEAELGCTLIRVERSRSLVQAQTLVIQSPLKIW